MRDAHLILTIFGAEREKSFVAGWWCRGQ